MSTTASIAPRALRPTAPTTVVHCYDLLDLALAAGVRDFTEGRYGGDPELSYDTAQRNQAEYLLDQARCEKGSRLLDVGCGYGRILETARDRGAEAQGITVSPVQATYCTSRGLRVRCRDYRELDGFDRFDAIIANGSLEHFVQADDAAAGRGDDIYREMFSIFHRLLAPEGRVVTTAIHFGGVYVDARNLVEPIQNTVLRGSPLFHFRLLADVFGGYYPVEGQLERCASDWFALEGKEDGTEDYRLTSEAWLAALRRAMRSKPRFLLGLAGKWVGSPRRVARTVDCLLVSQSWNWQFRGPNPPMRLWRQTWKRLG